MGPRTTIQAVQLIEAIRAKRLPIDRRRRKTYVGSNCITCAGADYRVRPVRRVLRDYVGAAVLSGYGAQRPAFGGKNPRSPGLRAATQNQGDCGKRLGDGKLFLDKFGNNPRSDFSQGVQRPRSNFSCDSFRMIPYGVGANIGKKSVTGWG